MSRWDGPPDSYYDPPLDPPLVECPDCEGTGRVDEGNDDEHGQPMDIVCHDCEGDGERYLTDEEVREARAEAQIERAEARRDDAYEG